MSKRQEIAVRKEAMLHELREAYRLGAVTPGRMAVSQRELSARYGLALRTVAVEMQKLVEERVLTIIPRVGTFVGCPTVVQPDYYLFALPPMLPVGGYSDYVNAARRGFEERIAERGGATVTLAPDVLQRYVAAAELPPIAGIFRWAGVEVDELAPGYFDGDAPRAYFGRPSPEEWARAEALGYVEDGVDFDNENGGEQATRHLLDLGHRRIGFLGLHAGETLGHHTMHWSFERETGWRHAMKRVALSSEGLSFLPTERSGLDQREQRASAREAARALLRHPAVTAVITVNELACISLLEELEAAAVPRRSWPAIVCFDDFAPKDEHILSSLNLPWTGLGHLAADRLWERKNGHISGRGELKLVAPRLVRRLSCRGDWSLRQIVPTALEPRRILAREAALA